MHPAGGVPPYRIAYSAVPAAPPPWSRSKDRPTRSNDRLNGWAPNPGIGVSSIFPEGAVLRIPSARARPSPRYESSGLISATSPATPPSPSPPPSSRRMVLAESIVAAAAPTSARAVAGESLPLAFLTYLKYVGLPKQIYRRQLDGLNKPCTSGNAVTMREAGAGHRDSYSAIAASRGPPATSKPNMRTALAVIRSYTYRSKLKSSRNLQRHNFRCEFKRIKYKAFKLDAGRL